MTRRAAIRDDGALTVFFVLLVPALVLVAGLVFDGGQLLAARRAVQDAAQDAARAGAQAVDVAAVREGHTMLAGPRAAVAARTWLAAEGESGSVSVSGDTVTVTVRRAVPLALLGAVGLSSRTVSATEQARIVRGVTGAET